ncbi:hypothetical protein N0V87_007405 [Didymella glomerata]|uniref:Transmembrane protein n=1 Tax=Didymella glomerata TaxID=749621 RepID=A0A9W8WUZ2_9PLEO|nr:hypothetical protein N0V87_007405 [Didymella glomerata]
MKFSTITLVLLALMGIVVSGGIQVSEELARDALDVTRAFSRAERHGVNVETAAAEFFGELSDLLAAARGASRSGDGYRRPDDNESESNKETAEAAKAINKKADRGLIVTTLGVSAGVLGTGFTFLIFLHSIGRLPAWFYGAEKRD